MDVAPPFFEWANWPAPPGVRGGSTRRRGLGASQPPFDTLNLGGHRSADGDAGEHVLANRVALREALELPSAPLWLRQVHGTAVFDADARTIDGVLVPADADEPEADAAVTRSPGVVLAVLHADCLPVLLCSDDGAVLGAAHAGWRGLAAGVVEFAYGLFGFHCVIAGGHRGIPVSVRTDSEAYRRMMMTIVVTAAAIAAVMILFAFILILPRLRASRILYRAIADHGRMNCDRQ
jgi:hypothetical protein